MFKLNVVFAESVKTILKDMFGSNDELNKIDGWLSREPLSGREAVEGIHAIRALNKHYHDRGVTLTLFYGMLTFPDSIPVLDEDEILVFHVGVDVEVGTMKRNDAFVSELVRLFEVAKSLME